MSESRRYTASDLHVLDDAIASIRRNRNLYLGSEEAPIGPTLAHKLMSALIHDRALPATISTSGDWWILSSHVDWIGRDYLARGLFSRILPDTRQGPNGYRQEILLAAFSRSLVVVDAEGVVWVRGDPAIEGLPMEAARLQDLGVRAVAYTADS
jgi:hypothetical protein